MSSKTTTSFHSHLEFEIQVGPGEGKTYPLLVVHAPAGEAHATLTLPFETNELENYLKEFPNSIWRSAIKQRKIISQEEQLIQDFGRKLFDSLLKGDVLKCYDDSQAQARREGKGLRLKLRILSPELAALPWEFIYDARRGSYVCLSANTPVVRCLEFAQSFQPVTVEFPLRILGMIANPKGARLPPLDVETEKTHLENALQPLQEQGLAELVWLKDGSWRSLQRALRKGPWHIFHFIGHGHYNTDIEQGELAFESETGGLETIDADRLANLLADHHPLALALLNACEGGQANRADIFSSIAAILIRRGLPAVLAMQYAITDRAAIELTRVFYESLADNLPVDAAVSEARKAIGLSASGSLEWGVPVLYLRSNDGKLFDLQEPLHVRPDPPSTVEGEKPKPPAVTKQPVKIEPPRPAEVRNSITLLLPGNIPLELLRIPAGEFTLGSNLADDEAPPHKLTLGDYFIGKYPVTNRQYEVFVHDTKHEPPVYWKDGLVPAGKELHPADNLNWGDALAFCKWASKVTRQIIRLPSEAEWEKAARGSDGRTYPWGEKFPDAARCNWGQGKNGTTTPVTLFDPLGNSPFGCVDMLGNVWEWTSSLFKRYPYQPKDGREDLTLRGIRVLRGGSFADQPANIRCSYRGKGPLFDYVHRGFRIVSLPT